jgi:hypothetical protein
VKIVAVGFAESSWRTDITHANGDGSTDYCWLQINDVNKQVFKGRDWRNPADCARMASDVKEQQGWGAWVTVKTGAYRKYIGKAHAAVAAAGVQ